jgi:ABC-type nitrate/sulfonate/bicarbonate transport system permease component
MSTLQVRQSSGSVWLAGASAIRTQVLTVVSILLLLILWQLLSTYLIDPLLLPPPGHVLEEAIKMLRTGELAANVLASVQRIFWGFVFGCVAGIPIGLFMGRSRIGRELILPVLNLIRPISPVALVPLVIVWFGIGETAKIVLVAYTTFIVMVFNSMSGAAAAPISRERAARCFGATELDIFRYVILPSALPYVLTGMRVGLGFCFMSVVAAELVAADSGIGFLIMQSRFSMLTERMFVGLAVLGILGWLSDWALRAIVRRFGRAYVGKEMSSVL